MPKKILAVHKEGVTTIDQGVLQKYCDHPIEHRKQMTTGAMWITNGQVHDTTQLHEVCTLCGKIMWSE